MTQIEFDKAKWFEDSDGVWISFRVNHPNVAKALVERLKEKTYTAEVKEYKKRSLDANAYCWVLIGKIADVIRANKEDIYFEMLKRYGQGGVIKIPKKYLELFKRTYKYYEKVNSYPDEAKAEYWHFWLGSSGYNSYEMSVLIDGIISECKEMGIETMTPEELARIKEEWD